jgi:hypothetical protein
MSNRILSLLTDIEQALKANDPSPDDGTWDTLRLINFHQGLARLTLAVRLPTGVTVGRGMILLQDFSLADGTQCVKANLSWRDVEKSSVYAIYSKPQMNWKLEAGQIANQWLDGHLAAVEAHAAAEHISDGPMMSATG